MENNSARGVFSAKLENACIHLQSRHYDYSAAVAMQASNGLRLTIAADRSNFRSSSYPLPKEYLMHTVNSSSAGAPVSSVPMLDVNRENKKLEAELDAAMAEVTRSGAFVHGPALRKV